jgi:hypothetical protein
MAILIKEIVMPLDYSKVKKEDRPILDRAMNRNAMIEKKYPLDYKHDYHWLNNRETIEKILDLPTKS